MWQRKEWHKVRPDVESLWGCFVSRVAELVKGIRPWTADEFVNSYKVARVRRRYERAKKQFETRGITERDSWIRGFLKYEKLPLKSGLNPIPRMVSPRMPVYNFAIGRYLKAAEEAIYHAIAQIYGGPTVMKSYNTVEIGGHFYDAWKSFKRPVAIGLDANRWDQSVLPEMLKLEHGCYNWIFNFDPQLQEWLSWQIYNHVEIRLGENWASYDVKGQRMSGDMNTGLGNCLLACALWFGFCRYYNLEKMRLFNNGDDCLVIIEEEDLYILNNLPQYYAKFGFDMTVEDPVRIFEKIVFCQMQPVFDGQRYVMCRDPRAVLEKDAMLLRACKDRVIYDTYRKSVSNSGLAMAGRLPLLSAFYDYVGRDTGKLAKRWDIPMSGLTWWTRGLRPGRYRPTPESRYSFWLAFGILPDMQSAFEDFYDRHSAALGARWAEFPFTLHA